MPLQIIRDDITRVACDAIVNPTDAVLSGSGGVDRLIHRAAGLRLLIEKQKISRCEPGRAVLTRGYDLPARYIIHTVGPRWKGGSHGEQEILRSCYRESLKLAKKRRLESIAFPLIASGTFGYPKELVLQAAMQEISSFLMENDMLVCLVVYDMESFRISRKLFSDIEEHIDDHYVQLRRSPLPSHSREGESAPLMDGAPEPPCRGEGNAFPSAPAASEAKSPPKARRLFGFPDAEELTRIVSQIDESFTQMLLRKIGERGMKDSECYKRANVDRKLFSKIRSDIHYRPRKQTVLAFAIALELSLEETDEMLQKAGYALSPSSKFDVIVAFFISRQQYDIYTINEALFAFDQSLLGC